MFNMPWIRLYETTSSIEVNTNVAIQVAHFGFYSLNFARIVYVVDEERPIRSFGFAYGTLEEHSECGEERFTVDWDRSNNQVWYNILAFSRPHKTLTKLGYPLARLLQRRFAISSKMAMIRATQGD
jgi:uncharacterized protein (UPF0548 family)